MLDFDITDVPENEGHGTTWTSIALLDIVPGISISKDSTRSVTIYSDSIAGNDKGSMMILESNWIRVVSPVV